MGGIITGGAMDKFDIVIDVPKIRVFSLNAEKDIEAKQIETILNCKYNDMFVEIIKRIKQEIKLV